MAGRDLFSRKIQGEDMRRQKITVKFREETEEVILEMPNEKKIMVTVEKDGFVCLRTLDHRFIIHPAGAVNVVRLEMRRFSE